MGNGAQSTKGSDFYDIGETLTTLGIGEAQQRLRASPQVREYATPVDRASAREMLATRAAESARAAEHETSEGRTPAASTRTVRSRASREPPSAPEAALNSPLARTVAGVVTRGLMGARLGGTRRRRR